MIVRKYETRLDENGLVAFEKVWSKRMDSYNSNHKFRNPDEVYELCKTLKLLNWTLIQKNTYFYSFLISKCILNRSLRWVLELIALVLLTEEV